MSAFCLPQIPQVLIRDMQELSLETNACRFETIEIAILSSVKKVLTDKTLSALEEESSSRLYITT